VSKAAKLFDLMLPDRCIVVPMPCHMGYASAMLEVANAMPGERFVMDALVSEPHESSYDAKRCGLSPLSFGMKFIPDALARAPKEDFDGGVFVIDNVICTGVTAGAALRAVQDCAGLDAIVCAIAHSPWR
jgi:hypothetical protein